MEDPFRKKTPSSYYTNLFETVDMEKPNSEWLGAALRYLWSLGKTPFHLFYTKKDSEKNIFTGRLIKIIMMPIIITLVYFINQ